MTFIDNFVSIWVDMIDKPIVINNKQGFLLMNGFRIFFEDTTMSAKSVESLKRRYKKQGLIKKQGFNYEK